MNTPPNKQNNPGQPRAHDDDDELVPPVLPCAGKTAYGTRREAEGAATVAKYRYGSHTSPYLCQYCDLWHLRTNYDEKA
jgi:hypothetical protein